MEPFPRELRSLQAWSSHLWPRPGGRPPPVFCLQRSSWEAGEVHRLCPGESVSAEPREGRALKCWAWGPQVPAGGRRDRRRGGIREQGRMGSREAPGLREYVSFSPRSRRRRPAELGVPGPQQPLLWVFSPRSCLGSAPTHGGPAARPSRGCPLPRQPVHRDGVFYCARRGPALPHLAKQMFQHIY